MKNHTIDYNIQPLHRARESDHTSFQTTVLDLSAALQLKRACSPGQQTCLTHHITSNADWAPAGTPWQQETSRALMSAP